MAVCTSSFAAAKHKTGFMNNLRTKARIFGVLFILAFLFYGIGNGMVDELAASPDALAQIANNKAQAVTGIILLAVLHSIGNIGLAVIMFSIVRQYSTAKAYGYLLFAIMATVLLTIGGVFLWQLLPLSEAYASATNKDCMQQLVAVCRQGNVVSYQLGMAMWAVGGVLLTAILYKTQLVPRWLSIWGMVGYVIFFAGTIAELFQQHIGVALSLPGGLFEIVLGIRAIVKGFNTVAN